MDKMEFRNLKADEIEAFPKKVKTDTGREGCMLLIYKDARCDMNILDETVGPMKWQRKHIRDNKNCIVSIYDDERSQWVSKEDTGAESFAEKEKGLASDSFKRACFNWGIGRELYTAPFIWVNLNSNEISRGKLDYKVKFHVDKIVTINGKINELVIKDQNNKTRFTYKGDTQSKSPDKHKPKPKAKPLAQSKIKALYAKANEKGYTKDSVKSTIKKHYNAKSTKDLTVEQFTEFMDKLEKAPPKEDKKDD